MGYYLGIDAGTQSIKGILIDPEKGVVTPAVSVHFGNELSRYNSPGGFLPNEDPLIRHADPLMWLDALDLLLQKMYSSKERILSPAVTFKGSKLPRIPGTETGGVASGKRKGSI